MKKYLNQLCLISLMLLLPVMYMLVPGYRWVVDDMFWANLKYIYQHPGRSDAQKKYTKYGSEKYALCFYLSHLPQEAKIIYPADSVIDKKYINICRESSWVASQIYPRVFITDEKDVKPGKTWQIKYMVVNGRDTFEIVPVP